MSSDHLPCEKCKCHKASQWLYQKRELESELAARNKSLKEAREEIEGLKRKMEATAARCNPDRRNFWDDREQLMNERDELKWKLALVDKRLEVIQSQAKGCILNSEEE